MIFMMSYTNNKYLIQLPKVHFQAENLLQELEEHFRALTTTLNLRNILFWSYQTLASRWLVDCSGVVSSSPLAACDCLHVMS